MNWVCFTHDLYSPNIYYKFVKPFVVEHLIHNINLEICNIRKFNNETENFKTYKTIYISNSVHWIYSCNIIMVNTCSSVVLVRCCRW